MKYKRLVDLHTHSTASDGDLSPEEVVNIAEEAGVCILALTDHDTIDGLEEAKKRADDLGIVFIPGMEISARSDEELHILGYYIEKDEPEFKKGIDLLVEYRNRREEITIEYLKEKGIEITAEEVKRMTRGNIIGRPHMAAVMVQKGYVESKKEAFEKYIGTPEYMSIERPKTTAEESIEIIKKGKGVPVLAHPHSLKQTFAELDVTLGNLKNMGLRGIECYYNSYTKSDTANYLTLAIRHKLVPVGGSDFHGPLTKPDVKLGTGKNNMLEFDNLHIAEILHSLK